MARSSSPPRLQSTRHLGASRGQPDGDVGLHHAIFYAGTLPGDPELRGSIRVWDFKKGDVVNTIQIPDAVGTMDVKLIPGDPHEGAFTAGMFDGLVYLVDTRNGTSQVVFDCEDIVPHFEVPVRGGMVQLLAMPRSGDRLLFASFQAGQVACST